MLFSECLNNFISGFIWQEHGHGRGSCGHKAWASTCTRYARNGWEGTHGLNLLFSQGKSLDIMIPWCLLCCCHSILFQYCHLVFFSSKEVFECLLWMSFWAVVSMTSAFSVRICGLGIQVSCFSRADNPQKQTIIGIAYGTLDFLFALLCKILLENFIILPIDVTKNQEYQPSLKVFGGSCYYKHTVSLTLSGLNI